MIIRSTTNREYSHRKIADVENAFRANLRFINKNIRGIPMYISDRLE
jgi:hypothetical protein